MSAATDFLENKIIDHMLRNQAYSPPAAVYLALSTTTPTDAGGNITEPSGSGYARAEMALDAASGGATANTNDETFTASGGNWGTITHFVVFDASTNGNALLYGALAASRTINDGDTLEFGAGDIDITVA